ncbi:unnamed protein product [Chondrus crispus]|uniref:Ubiquitin-like protease family profile domain-containing protein n=1 Tax=Chondrus crispus TaxID=2769 RepID=R7QEB2_CHOCR|nr:unnamed protein product [Chondrus crispus]CDF36093.1 unnamed protein product [Chondrus crispus]|eukprot:XP_005715912.1 unnamed protein product [Chondrus crispus]
MAPHSSNIQPDNDEVQVIETDSRPRRSHLPNSNRGSGENSKLTNAKRPVDSQGNGTRRSQRSRSAYQEETQRHPRTASRKPASLDKSIYANDQHSRCRSSKKNDPGVVDVDANSEETPSARVRDQSRHQLSSARAASSKNSSTHARPNLSSNARKTKKQCNERSFKGDRQRRDRNTSEISLPRKSRSAKPSERPIPLDDDDDDNTDVCMQSTNVTANKRPLRSPSPPALGRRARLCKTKRLKDTDEVAEEAKQLQALDAPFTGPCHFLFKFPPTGRGSIRVTAEERGRLNSRQYLNDTLIDFYIKYLEHGLAYRPDDKQFTTKFFSSFFFGVLRRGKPGGYKGVKSAIDYDGVKGWTKGVDLFSLEYVFVPICDSYHWSLIIVANLHELQDSLDGKFVNGSAKPKIFYLDSLDPKRGQEFGIIMLHYLVEEYLNRKKSEDVSDSLHEETFNRFKKAISIQKVLVPLQSNEYDCGLYVLNNLAMFLENRDDFMMKLLDDELNLKEVYSHMDIQGLRIDITSLLSTLEDNWNKVHPKFDVVPNMTDADNGADNRKEVEDSPTQEASLEGEPTCEDGDIPQSPPPHEWISVPNGKSCSTEPTIPRIAAGFRNRSFSKRSDQELETSEKRGYESSANVVMQDCDERYNQELDSSLPWHGTMPGDEEGAAVDTHEEGDYDAQMRPVGDTKTNETIDDGNGILPFFRQSANHHEDGDTTKDQVLDSGMAADFADPRSRLVAQASEERSIWHESTRSSDKVVKKKHRLREEPTRRQAKKRPASGYGGAKSLKARSKVGSHRRTKNKASSAADVEIDGSDRSPVTMPSSNVEEQIIDGSEAISVVLP